MKYTVIRDTREKDLQGWWWPASQYCAGTVEGTLKTGDYTLRGYENMLAIERKGCIAEWAKNITQGRFERELERLNDVRFPFVLLEFTMTDVMNYPIGSNIPRHQWAKLKFRGSYILKRIIEFQMKYKAHIILCGGSGKEVASSIFKRTIEIIENVENVSAA